MSRQKAQARNPREAPSLVPKLGRTRLRRVHHALNDPPGTRVAASVELFDEPVGKRRSELPPATLKRDAHGGGPPKFVGPAQQDVPIYAFRFLRQKVKVVVPDETRLGFTMLEHEMSGQI